MKSIELMAPVNALINVPVRVRRDRWTTDRKVQKAWHTNDQKQLSGERGRRMNCVHMPTLMIFTNWTLSIIKNYRFQMLITIVGCVATCMPTNWRSWTCGWSFAIVTPNRSTRRKKLRFIKAPERNVIGQIYQFFANNIRGVYLYIAGI